MPLATVPSAWRRHCGDSGGSMAMPGRAAPGRNALSMLMPAGRRRPRPTPTTRRRTGRRTIGLCRCAHSFRTSARPPRRLLDDSAGVAECRNSIGLVARVLGDTDRAESLHKHALEALRAQGDRRGVAVSLNNLAAIVYFRGDLTVAGRRWEEAIEAVRSIGDQRSVGLLLGNVGAVRLAQGDGPARSPPTKRVSRSLACSATFPGLRTASATSATPSSRTATPSGPPTFSMKR